MILIVVSCVLMTLDHQFNYFNKMRSTLSLVVAPMQYFVDRPVQLIRWGQTSFTTQQGLLIENAQLRARELLLFAKLQKVLALERENAQLRALLKSSAQIHDKVSVAQLLAVDLAPYTQQIIIDKGQKDGVFVGQPVLDAYGIMGQIISVTSINSRVLLITDPRSAVPVQDNRNGNRAIAAGLGFDGSLELINVPMTTDFRKGDFLVTSGLGGNYPPGYPVGVITNIKFSPGDRFVVISVKPAAHVNQSRQVLLVWPKEGSDKQPMPATELDMQQIENKLKQDEDKAKDEANKLKAEANANENKTKQIESSAKLAETKLKEQQPTQTENSSDQMDSD